jgi:hypothetical protein
VALVLDARRDALHAIALDDTASPLATVSLSEDPLAADGPAAIVVDPSRRVAFVALAPPLPPHPPGPHNRHVLLPSDGALVSLSLDTLSVRARARTEPDSDGLALSADRAALWLSSRELLRALDARLSPEARNGTLTRRDPDTLAVTAHARPCLVPSAVAADPTGSARAWVACFGEDALSSVQVEGDTLAVERFVVGEGAGRFPSVRYAPQRVAVDAARGRVWSSQGDSRDLRAFSMVDRRIQVTVLLAATPMQPLVDGARVLVPTRDPASVVVVEGDAIASRFALDESVCVSPVSLARDPRGLYLLCEGDESRDGAIVSLDPMTAARALRRWPVPGRASAMALFTERPAEANP